MIIDTFGLDTSREYDLAWQLVRSIDMRFMGRVIWNCDMNWWEYADGCPLMKLGRRTVAFPVAR